jgi:hypothetical protein
MNAPVDLPDDGDVLSIGRRYRSTLGRLYNLDTRWVGMVDGAPGKWEAAEAARAMYQESERLLLAVFRRRSDTIGDIAVMAAHAFAVLDRSMCSQEMPDRASVLVLRGLADIAATASKAAGVDFSMIGPPGIHTRVRECLGR